ncbi:hypothetical protein Esti_001506 [Eimeria stiedai]
MARRAALIAVLCLCGTASASQSGGDDASFVETVYFRKNGLGGESSEPQVDLSFGSGSGPLVGSSADVAVPRISQQLTPERADLSVEEGNQISGQTSNAAREFAATTQAHCTHDKAAVTCCSVENPYSALKSSLDFLVRSERKSSRFKLKGVKDARQVYSSLSLRWAKLKRMIFNVLKEASPFVARPAVETRRPAPKPFVTFLPSWLPPPPPCRAASESSHEPSFGGGTHFAGRPLGSGPIQPSTKLVFESYPEAVPEHQNPPAGPEAPDPTLDVPGVFDGIPLDGKPPLTPEDQEPKLMRFFRLVREVFLAMRQRLD